MYDMQTNTEKELTSRNMDEKDEKAAVTNSDEPEVVKYRGIKAMPFVIGQEMGTCFEINLLMSIWIHVVCSWNQLFIYCREWDLWEARNTGNLIQPVGLSHHSLQHEKHHSYKSCQCLQWHHQRCYLARSLPLRYLFRPLQDLGICFCFFFSGISSTYVLFISL